MAAACARAADAAAVDCVAGTIVPKDRRTRGRRPHALVAVRSQRGAHVTPAELVAALAGRPGWEGVKTPRRPGDGARTLLATTVEKSRRFGLPEEHRHMQA